jgi:SOS-response transcriptional repressor LexA
MPNDNIIRPTKKQRALLEFIAQFIAEHGYSPCYREIMTGLGYTSVATVSLHVTSLIKRGHLQKRDRSARSLEVVSEEIIKTATIQPIKAADEKWLVDIVESRFAHHEKCQDLTQREIDNLFVLVGALRVLGLEEAARSFIPRLGNVKAKNK